MAKRHLAMAGTVAVGLVAAGCGSTAAGSGGAGSGSARQIIAAGSTLVAPLMSQWEADYQRRTGVTITYGAIGSGGGIAATTARTVDIGASDAPLTPGQRVAADARGRVVQIPWALGATVIAYNVKGVPDNLHLTGPVLADIYLGTIKTWDDPRIARLNPGVHLPTTAITPVYRSDGSGDTYALTDYLSKISPAWRSQVGTATQVSFPTGVGGKGNSGVGGALSSTDGAIAYIAISYVLANGLNHAEIANAAGRYPAPGVASIGAAAQTVTSVPPSNAISITDPPASAPDAYPISTFTYALVPARSADAPTIRAFLDYAIGSGQRFASRLAFAPLPARVLAADRATIGTIR